MTEKNRTIYFMDFVKWISEEGIEEIAKTQNLLIATKGQEVLERHGTLRSEWSRDIETN